MDVFLTHGVVMTMTIRLLQVDAIDGSVSCPCCHVRGYMTYDLELDSRLDKIPVKCPYVSSESGKCQWTGLYGDFWEHVHWFVVTPPRKRTATNANLDTDDDDTLPAAKRPTTSDHLSPSSTV